MKRLAYALLALCWIAGIALWFWPRRDPRGPEPLSRLASGAQAGESRAADAKVATAAPVVAPHSRRLGPAATSASGDQPLVRLQVRSSVGLPLLWVEGQNAAGEWERADILGDTLEIEPDTGPFLLRAPGHAAVEVPVGAHEVLLEPDALLCIDSPHLRTSIQGLQALRAGEEARRVRESGLLAEFPDADHLLVAFSPAVLAPAFPGDIDVAFQRSDGSAIELRVHAQSGLRASWSLPSSDLAGCAPFRVEIEGTDPRSSWTSLRLSPLDASPPPPEREEFAWGSVQIRRNEAPAFPDPIWGRPKEAHLEALELGRRYLLCGQDTGDHYGSLVFVHDGSDRTLVLREPLLVRARVVDADGGGPIHLPQARVTPTDAAPDPTWTADYGYGLDGEGMALPQDWVRSRSAQIEPPESFTIDVFAAGHRSARRTFERKGRSIVDLGEIALARSARSIVVADPDFTPGRSVGSAALSFADRPEVEWGIRHAFYARDDKREIELDWRGEEALVGWHDLLSGETDARAFTRELGELVLLASDGEAYALRLGAQSEYRILPRHVCALEIDCERLSASGTWTLGWRGGGTWARFRAVNAVRRTSERLALPELATELWWSAGEAPPDLCKQPGGSLALDGTAQTIVLR